jgi:hypothetical protein
MLGVPKKGCSVWNRANKLRGFLPEAAWGGHSLPNGKSGRQMSAACGEQFHYLGVSECPLLTQSGHRQLMAHDADAETI